MKRILYSIAILLTLNACSFNDVVALLVTPTVPPPPVETSTPTVFYTPSQTPTITPVPTFTYTPTLAGLGGSFNDSSEVPTGDSADALPTLVLIPTATPGPQTSLFSEPGSIITSISLSSDTLLWGYCDASKYVDFDVRLANSLRVVYVLLFMRLVDKGGNQSIPWGGGAIMEEVGNSSYTYRVTPANISHYNEFKDAWIQYQVVAVTYGLNVLGSSPVYQQILSLRECLPVEVEE